MVPDQQRVFHRGARNDKRLHQTRRAEQQQNDRDRPLGDETAPHVVRQFLITMVQAAALACFLSLHSSHCNECRGFDSARSGTIAKGVCLSKAIQELPRTLGALRLSSFSEAALANRSVKDELRNNLICKIQRGDTLFPGILGYEDTVIPQVVNAILSRHNFILLGLRGQAKTRLIRMLTTLLDEAAPYIEGCEIHDNPYKPICRRCRMLVAEQGDETPIAWLHRDHRYVEKLATPDVTIADMIGDIDPIKAARRGHDISDELTVHYGLLPRANRGIFAINELPDLAGKIQVGLFNIMQEGDVQIKGYPVRLPLDLMLVFTANP